ncbi:DNA-directed RNA polymerase subunit beta [candidate division WOR-3 bacterium]|nr:DNA-directed RNA polymerase subunit beta [candidate division WOR-3 bacterium]
MIPKRKNYGKVGSLLDIPNLISLQFNSFRDFLQVDLPPEARKMKGLEAVFRETYPIEDTHGRCTLEYVKYSIGKPNYTPEEAIEKGVTHAAPLKGIFRLITSGKDKEISEAIEQEVYLCELPLMTETGTFIINGVERVVISQLHRSPGAYFFESIHPTGKRIYLAQIIPYRGSWIEFSFDTRNILYVNLNRRKKFPITILLKALGFQEDEEIIKYLFNTSVMKIEDTENLSKSPLLGKYIASDVISRLTGEIIAEAGRKITPALLNSIVVSKVGKVETVKTDTDNAIELLTTTLKKDGVRGEEEALENIYSILRGTKPPNIDLARRYLLNTYFSDKKYNIGDVGRYKMASKFGYDMKERPFTLTKDDILDIVKYIFQLTEGKGFIDDIDHLGNRRLKSVGELLNDQFRVILSKMGRSIKEKMLLSDKNELTPSDLINERYLSSSIKSFFATSQLSQFMEQTNPLSELTHKRRLSALGPGGLKRETASFEVRDVHYSHYGRICPIETPEGPNIGLITSLSTYAQINKYGFITSPYIKIKNGTVSGRVEYLTADEEDRYTIAQANTPIDSKGRIKIDSILSRRRGNFPIVSPKKLDYMDVSPKQLVSTSAALIPFLEHDDANRALMGSNMQRQAVPLLIPESPIVGTGMELRVAIDSGTVITAKRAGVVKRVNSCIIEIEPSEKKNKKDKTEIFSKDVYYLRKFKRTNQNTCINQKPLARIGDVVKKNEVIADGAATEKGELALGTNVLVAFMPWRGYNFEDAIIVSEKLLKDDKFTSIHIEEFETEVRETKLGPEELTREIPNVGEESVKYLDEYGIVMIGAEVGPDDILVGKVTPKGETELTPEEKLLRAIFRERAVEVRDTSLRVPPGISGIVVDVKALRKKSKREKLDPEELSELKKIEKMIRVEKRELLKKRDEYLAKLLQGKKCIGNVKNIKGKTIFLKKKVFTKEKLEIVNFDDLIFPGGSVYDGVDINKLYIKCNEKMEELDKHYKRTKENRLKGDELPYGVTEKIKVFVAERRRLSVGDKLSGRHGNKGVIAKIVPEEDMPYMEDGTTIEIILNPLGVPSRMNLGQVLETHLGWAVRTLGYKISTPVFEGVTVDEIKMELRKAQLPEEGKAVLHDGYTGEPFASKVTVGYAYIMKLSHMVDDKIHARSSGPYSLITQQPLGGKAQFGGQRFGEMEVWALEAYGAAYTLQEILTVKSDDVSGRTHLYESIIKGENPPDPGLPASFNVLIKELQGLCLDIELGKEKS